MQPLRRRLLNRTLSYYRVFAESGRHTPAMQNVLGHVWYRIGVIEQELGRMDTAESAFDTAVTIQTKLANASSSSQDRLSLSTTLNGFGVLRMKQQRVEDARELFERALDLRVQLLSSDIDEVEIRRLHANTVMNLGTVDRNQGRAATARGQFREAARQYRTLLDRVQGDLRLTIQLQRELAKALFNSANAAIDALMAEDASDVGETDTADRAEIRQLLVEANQLFRRVLEYEADSYPDRRRLAWCLQMQVECAADEEEAMALYREAIDELQRLASENRSVPELTVELAQVELSRGRLAADTAQFETAVQDFESGLLRLQQLSAEESQTRDRDIAVFRAELTLARAALGLVDSKMIAEALQEVEHQLAIHADDHELLLLQRQLRQARQPTVL